jgi:hypothetical protein
MADNKSAFLTNIRMLFLGQFGDLEGKKSLVLYSPLLALITFGLYSIAVIIYRYICRKIFMFKPSFSDLLPFFDAVLF